MIFFDLLTSISVLIAAVCIFASFVMSSPRYECWLPLPSYVRFGMFCLGTVMLFRGVDLWELACCRPVDAAGHADLLTVLGSLTNTFYFMTVMVSLFVTRFSPLMVAKISELIRQEHSPAD